MSMHKIPLSELERSGLEKYRLSIGTPSQLSDSFRAGVDHALNGIDNMKALLIQSHEYACKAEDSVLADNLLRAIEHLEKGNKKP